MQHLTPISNRTLFFSHSISRSNISIDKILQAPKTIYRVSLFIFILLLTMPVSKLLAQDKLYSNSFSLSQVKLLDGPFKHACDLNVHVLLEYDADRFLSPFLREAGLPVKKPSYGNWEKDGLDGHVGGHYLTALAIHYAATGNAECKTRLDYMVAELKRCQLKNGDGYIGGIPNGKHLWDEIKKGNTAIIWKYWVPWYNMHKTYAGLRDAWVYAGNQDALKMFLDLCDWGLTIIDTLDDEKMEAMLGNEFGGMNEVYADAYQITRDLKYLNAAKKFSHKQIYESMAHHIDNLDNKHANTQVPKAVGYQRVAELSKDKDYTAAAEFFWKTVVENRTLSLGGNSRREHFPEAADCKSYMDEREGPESCNTNNMLKLTEGLFRMNHDARYADFYERAMYNHILSTQHPVHGGYVYFTPARPSHYRVYSAPNSAMWCCVGTGMENHGKYGEFIYTHNNDSLYVNLFVASELNWTEKNIVVEQNTSFPYEEGSRLTIKVKDPVRLKILVRHPWWVSAAEMKVSCSGVDYAQGSQPSSYIVIDRVWKNGDVVEIKTPMKVTIEEMPNTPDAISILRGPILLGAKTSTDNMPGLIADDGRWSHIASGSLVSVFDAPYIIGERTEILSKLNQMKPVEGKPFTYTVPELFVQSQYKNLVLEPFYQIHDSRYMMYWLSMTQSKFEQFVQDKKDLERAKMLLDKRTVDAVKTGEQQPEVDHQMTVQNSNRGVYQGEAWRDARNGGFFQYNMSTKGYKDLLLMVRYRGNESGSRKFKILIDNRVVATEDIAGKWTKDSFVNVEYKIPAKLLKRKKTVTVRFESVAGGTAGAIFNVRLLRPSDKVTIPE